LLQSAEVSSSQKSRDRDQNQRIMEYHFQAFRLQSCEIAYILSR